jgi:hypothetical protein
MERERDQLIPSKRLKAIQEELAGFLNKEVLVKNGEFYHRDTYFVGRELDA